MVYEEGIPGELVLSILQIDGYSLGVHRRVTDHVGVLDTAVLLPGDIVVDESGMGDIVAAQIVGAHFKRVVHRLLILQHTQCLPALVEDSQIEFRSYVLGVQETYVGLLLVLEGEDGTPVGQFGVRRLDIVERHILRHMRIGDIRCIGLEAVQFPAAEEVDILHGGAYCTEIHGVQVLLVERIFGEPVIERGVHVHVPVLVDIRSGIPRKYPLVIQAVRDKSGFQHPRLGPADTVPDTLQAVADPAGAVPGHLPQFPRLILLRAGGSVGGGGAVGQTRCINPG